MNVFYVSTHGHIKMARVMIVLFIIVTDRGAPGERKDQPGLVWHVDNEL